MAKVLLVNGPNLNLLGEREPEIYGRATLGDIEGAVRGIIEQNGNTLECFQSNHEGAIVDWLQQNRPADFLLMNAGAFTHTSVAIRDTVSAMKIPLVEIHISNVHRREGFRAHSYFSDIATGVIVGLGVKGYEYAANFALEELSKA